MASFTDSSSIPLTPYTPKVDLNLYANTLRYKQNAYDEGISRVQGALDNVSGLDIYRPVDKQYLEQKVNDVTSQLQAVAKGDFSSQAIVNQATGMVGKIAKDPNIQAAVISTQNIKTLLASQKEMKEKHPDQYSSQNEWFDTRAVNDYLNNPNVGTSYGGPREATPYYDWHKPVKEALDKLGPQVSYKIGADGQFQYMIDKSSKVSPSDIENLVNGILATDPRAQHQIGIDGLYTYKDYDTKSLGEHLQHTYNSQIEQLNSLNTSYLKQKSSNPNDPTLVKQIDKAVADNQDAIKRLSSTRDNYLSSLSSGDLDGVKRTLFNDQVRRTMITNYQKDNHEFEMKTNENAIQSLRFTGDEADRWLKFVQSGIDPDTKQAITPGSKYYSQYIASKKAKGKGEDGGLDQSTANQVIPGSTTGAYDLSANMTQMKSLVDQIGVPNSTGGIDGAPGNYTEKLKSQYAKKTTLDPGTPEFNEAFNTWMKTQEANLQNQSGKVDPDYLSYKTLVNPLNIQLGALRDISTNVSKVAAQSVPIANKDITITGLDVRNPDGSHANSIKLNTAKDAHFMNEFYDIYNKTLDYIKSNTQVVDDNGQTYQPDMDQAAKAVIEQYKGSPDYHLYQALLKKGINSSFNTILGDYKNAMSQRQNVANKEMEKYGKTWSYQASPITGKEEEINAYRVQIATAINSNAGTDQGDVKIVPQDIHPLMKYSDLSGNMYMTYTEGKKGSVVKSVQIPTTENTMADPYLWLNKAIETSPLKRTPITGDGVMTSTNGKVRYAVGKNELSGMYDLYILDGQNPHQISMNSSITDPGQIVQKVEALSKLPLTTQQIIDKINEQ